MTRPPGRGGNGPSGRGPSGGAGRKPPKHTSGKGAGSGCALVAVPALLLLPVLLALGIIATLWRRSA
jgi:hypothetical protein